MTSRRPNQYDELRQDFSNIFYANNLDVLVNGSLQKITTNPSLGKDLGVDEMVDNFDNKPSSLDVSQPFQYNDKSPIVEKSRFDPEKQAPYLPQVFQQ